MMYTYFSEEKATEEPKGLKSRGDVGERETKREQERVLG